MLGSGVEEEEEEEKNPTVDRLRTQFLMAHMLPS